MQNPTRNRLYQNHHLDSTRWEAYAPKAGDIIVSTSYKSGTTWMQQILHALLFRDFNVPLDLGDQMPWVEWRFGHGTVDDLKKILAALPNRRVLKTHLPLDGLPYHAQVRYIVIARDPRDVCISLYNHYLNYTDRMFEMLNTMPGRCGEAIPPCPEDLRLFWRQWMSKGSFEWEHEGWPFWSNLGHTQSYWSFRHLPNILLIHYADMLADIRREIRKVANFIGLEVTDTDVTKVMEATAFHHIKRRAHQASPLADRWQMVFKGGLDAFYHKGTNGRWRDVLTPEDLDFYEITKRKVLSPDCAKWLEKP